MALVSQHSAHPRTAPWQRTAALAPLMILVAMLWSCSAGTSETAASCSGNSDLDGDGQSGCSDSDCYRFAHCRVPSALVSDAGPIDPAGGEGGGGGSVTPIGGSGGTIMNGGMDGAVVIDDDAGIVPDANLCDCRPDEVCTATGCVPVTSSDSIYTIRMVSADSPRGRPGPPPDGTCVEIACNEGGGSPVSYCPCKPEPYVRVVLVSAPDVLDPIEINLLDTKVQGEMLSVMFGEEDKVDVELKPSDKLRFELWDKNVVTPDVLVYTCEPDLHDLEPGTLECMALSGPLGLDEFWVRATLDYAR